MKCWDIINKEFNSESNTFRDAVTLKNCWENLKKRTRKYYAEERTKLYKTGKIIYYIPHIFMYIYILTIYTLVKYPEHIQRTYLNILWLFSR